MSAWSHTLHSRLFTGARLSANRRSAPRRTRSPSRDVGLAAELADDHGSTITAVVVIEMPAQLPLDAHMLEEEAAAKRTLETPARSATVAE